MWITFERLEEKKNEISKKTGNRYDCFVLHGTSKKFGEDVVTPYTKTILPSTAITVIVNGVPTNGCSLVEFLKHCKSGDLLKVASERDGRFFRWATIEKGTGTGSSRNFTPLPQEIAGSEATPPWAN